MIFKDVKMIAVVLTLSESNPMGYLDLSMTPKTFIVSQNIDIGPLLTAYAQFKIGHDSARSDLDLVIKSPIKKVEISLLEEKFEESDLPFKVDILTWDSLDESFKNQIEKDLVRLK